MDFTLHVLGSATAIIKLIKLSRQASDVVIITVTPLTVNYGNCCSLEVV